MARNGVSYPPRPFIYKVQILIYIIIYTMYCTYNLVLKYRFILILRYVLLSTDKQPI